MQPAYYESFEEIQKKLWSMLDDAVISEVRLLEYQYLFVPTKNDIDGRIVVLRKSDKNKNILQFTIWTLELSEVDYAKEK